MTGKVPDFEDLMNRLMDCVDNPEAIEDTIKEWVDENEEGFESDVQPDGTYTVEKE